MDEIERELKGIARAHPVMRTLLEIPGIGAITATALYASIGKPLTARSSRELLHDWLPARE
jgi:transposase